MAVFDIEALKAEREQITQAKHDAITYATQAVQEFAAVAQQIGTPMWTPPNFMARDLSQDGFTQGWMVLRNSAVSGDLIQTYIFGAIVEAHGNHRFQHKRATADTLGQWIAAICGYDKAAVERVFHQALVDVPLTSAEV